MLEASNIRGLTEEQCQCAAAIALESILGEEIVISKIDDFSLVERLEPEMANKARSIKVLGRAFEEA